MKVTNVNSGKSASSATKAKKSSSKGDLFAESMKEVTGTPETAETVESSAISTSAVLAVQEAPDATEHRSRGLSISYGEGVLDRLEDIRRDLLAGAVPKEKLSTLAQSMRAHRNASKDEKLIEILNEIELRAEVEIAKLTREN